MRRLSLPWLGMALAAAGCGGSPEQGRPPLPPGPAAPATAVPPSGPASALSQALETARQQADASGGAAEQVTSGAGEQASQGTRAGEPNRDKAGVGMGEKGRGYGMGAVATPIKALWAVREQAVLIQIRSAMQLYKAADPEGRAPKSHQEFMDKIIKANYIRLPALPAGDRYVYDPQEEELFVEHPRQP